jgi:hypothetical protein
LIRLHPAGPVKEFAWLDFGHASRRPLSPWWPLPGCPWQPPPASAAPCQGWIYISTPQWLSNCVDGKNNGPVTGLLMAVGDTYSSRSWDRADDIVYAKVNLGQRQQVSYEAFCSKPWPGRYQPGMAQLITPTPSRAHGVGWASRGALQLAPLRLAELRSLGHLARDGAGQIISSAPRAQRAPSALGLAAWGRRPHAVAETNQSSMNSMNYVRYSARIVVKCPDLTGNA